MTTNAVYASLEHLTAGQARNKDAISKAIDAVVSAHQHGGKDAFDERIVNLRSTIANAYATTDAIHDTARTAVGLPVGAVEERADPKPVAQVETVAAPVAPRKGSETLAATKA